MANLGCLMVHTGNQLVNLMGKQLIICEQTVNKLRNSLTGRVDGACIMPLLLLVNQLPTFDGVYLSCLWFLFSLWISGRGNRSVR